MVDFPNPVDTFTRGFNQWYVWVILIVFFIIWLVRVDRDMKNRGEGGLFEDMWGDWFD